MNMRISKDCIDGCVEGDNVSQRELYDQLLPYLNALSGRYLNDTFHRKDVLQEAFILISNRIDQFDATKGEFHSWASKILINQCLKNNRRFKGKYYSQIENHEEPQPVSPEILNQLTNEEIVRFLRTMPPKYYEVFNLHIIDGYSHEEIGELLGIRVSSSRKRLSRARAWLQAKPNSLNTLLGDYRFSIS